MEASDFTRRDLASAAGAFLSGTLALLMLPALPRAAVALAIGAVAVSAVFVRKCHGVRLVIWGCCGFLLAFLHAQHQLRNVWPESSAGERVRARIVVESIPEPRGGDWSFDATARLAEPGAHSQELHVQVLSRDPAVRPHAGERWDLVLTLRPPRAALNPGAMDRERLMFHEHIHALGTVVSSRLNRRIDGGHRPLAAIRELIARHIEERVADRDAAGLIAALAVGATGGMSREQWRVFNATGTTHLVAISGLHVTMFAVVMLALARKLWAAFLWRFVQWKREPFAAVFGMCAATGYAVLAGLSVPTQRTLLMLAAWLFTRCVARNASALQPFAVALLAVLVMDPFATLATGFWLSFGAMSGILLATGTRIVRRSTLHEAVAVQLTVTVLLLPLTLACFGSVSVLGPLVNALAIPYMSWLLVPVVLFGVALIPLSSGAADFVFTLAEWVHNQAWPWLASAADSPYALAYASPPFWWYGLALCSVPFLFVPWPVRIRFAALLCVSPLAVVGHPAPHAGELEVTMLDVGEGTAVIVRSSHHVVVYGTGESYGTAGSRTENVLIPVLRSEGIRDIDQLVIPRLTPVTGEGVTALHASMPVARTLIGGRSPADFPGAAKCIAGTAWDWDGIGLRILDSCQLQVSVAGIVATVEPGAMRVESPELGRWTMLSGRSRRSSSEHVLATADVGAVRVTIAHGAAVAISGMRGNHPALWRGPPPAPTFR
jgi:competence protein ComEC